MRVFAGCDGGGTKCVVRVVGYTRSGEIVAAGRSLAGPANVLTNQRQALQNILTATQAAFIDANLPSEFTAERLVAGLAGTRHPAVQEKWKQLLGEQLPFRDVQVLPDVELLFVEQSPASEGVVASVIGTGSVAYFRDQHGHISRAGGGGPQLGDLGSGFWMGRQVIELADRFAELGELVARHFQTNDLEGIKQRLNKGDLETAAVASLALSLFHRAAGAASEITDQAAMLIADLLIDVLPPQSAGRPIPWVCSGGVAIHQPQWLETIRSRCAEHKRMLSPPNLVPEPVAAALRLARK